MEQKKPHQNQSSIKPLFRYEILEEQNRQKLGSIRLSQPIQSNLIVIISLFIAAGIIAFIVLGSYVKKAHIAGVVVSSGGSLGIQASNPGILVHNFVAEGQQVKEGQRLFELSTERQGDQGEISELIAQQISVRKQALDSERRMHISQDSEKRRSIDAKLRNLSTESDQLDQEINLAKRRETLAQLSLEKFKILQVNGFVSSSQTQQKQEDEIDVAARLSSLSRSKVQLKATGLTLLEEKEAQVHSLAAELSQLDRDVASLEQERVENKNRKSSLIIAPRSGIVTTITYQPGQAVSSGQVLATLLATSEGNSGVGLEVYLYAPSRAAGFVAIGQHVLIRYQAFPYQKFGLQDGVVSDVSKTPFAPSELPTNLASTILSNSQLNIPGSNNNESLYRIKVRLMSQAITLYGITQPLKPGMTLDADVLQDRRNIWEWIAEPLLAIAHR